MPYVYANVKVKYGQLPAFFEQMVTIKRVMEENGWKLIGAWSTLNHTISGKTSRSMTGMSSDCASLISLHAAPMAIKIAPKRIHVRISNATNQPNSHIGSMSA